MSWGPRTECPGCLLRAERQQATAQQEAIIKERDALAEQVRVWDTVTLGRRLAQEKAEAEVASLTQQQTKLETRLRVQETDFRALMDEARLAEERASLYDAEHLLRVHAEAEVASLKAEIADWQRRNANQVGIIAGFSQDVTEARQQRDARDAEIARLKEELHQKPKPARCPCCSSAHAHSRNLVAGPDDGVTAILVPCQDSWHDIAAELKALNAQLTEARAQLTEQLRIVTEHWAVIEAQRAELLKLNV